VKLLNSNNGDGAPRKLNCTVEEKILAMDERAKLKQITTGLD